MVLRVLGRDQNGRRKEGTASLPGLQITVAFWESVLENGSVGHREQRGMKMD